MVARSVIFECQKCESQAILALQGFRFNGTDHTFTLSAIVTSTPLPPHVTTIATAVV